MDNVNIKLSALCLNDLYVIETALGFTSQSGVVDQDALEGVQVKVQNILLEHQESQKTEGGEAAIKDQYQVLEHAGLFNEKCVAERPSFMSAKAYVESNYSSDEVVELSVDITKNHSTEY